MDIPVAPVQSVAGKQGAVIPAPSDLTIFSAAPGTAPVLTGKTWVVRAKIRPLAILEDQFTEFNETFDVSTDGAGAGTGTMTPLSGATGTVTVAGGTWSLAASGVAQGTGLRTWASCRHPYQFVASPIKTFGAVIGSGGGYDDFLVGFSKADVSAYVFAQYQHKTSNGALSLLCNSGSGGSVLGATIPNLNLAAGTYLGLGVMGTFATIFTTTDPYRKRNWVRRLTRDLSAAGIDPRLNSWLNATYPACKITQDAGQTGAFGEFVSGAFGHTGVENLRRIKYSTGEPFEIAGKRYYLGTSGGICNTNTVAINSVNCTHMSVWEFDRFAKTLRCCGKIFVARGSGVYGDSGGSLSYSRSLGKWVLLTNKWGDAVAGGAAGIQYATFSENLLFGTHVVSGLTDLITGSGGTAVYEGGLTEYATGKFAVCYAESTNTGAGSPSHICMNVFASGLSGSSVKCSDSTTNYEGCNFVYLGGTTYVTASSSTDLRLYTVDFNAPTITFGSQVLAWGSVTGFIIGAAPPHGDLDYDYASGQTTYHIRTFDSTVWADAGATDTDWSWGTFNDIRMEDGNGNAVTRTGYEFTTQPAAPL